MTAISPNTSTALAKLAALRTSVDQALSGGIRMTGTSASYSQELIERFLTLREELRASQPEIFGDAVTHSWSLSIASQTEVLREVRRDIDHLLALAVQTGLITPVQAHLSPTTSPPPSGVRKWIVDHLVQIAVGLLLTYLAVRFGWS